MHIFLLEERGGLPPDVGGDGAVWVEGDSGADGVGVPPKGRELQ